MLFPVISVREIKKHLINKVNVWLQIAVIDSVSDEGRDDDRY